MGDLSRREIFGGSLLFFCPGNGAFTGYCRYVFRHHGKPSQIRAWMDKIKKMLGITIILIGKYFLIKMRQLLF